MKRLRGRDQMRQGFDPMTRLAASVLEKACRDRADNQDRWAKARTDGKKAVEVATAAEIEEIDTFLMHDSIWHQILGIDPDILGEVTHGFDGAALKQAIKNTHKPGHHKHAVAVEMADAAV